MQPVLSQGQVSSRPGRLPTWQWYGCFACGSPDHWKWECPHPSLEFLAYEKSRQAGKGKGKGMESGQDWGGKGGKSKDKGWPGLPPKQGVWTWPGIKVSGYRWDTTHPKAVGGHLVASNLKQEKKKPPIRGAHGGQGQPLWVWKA